MITHLLYTDDTLLFLNRRESFISGIFKTSGDYCNSSGHKINTDKGHFLLDKDTPLEHIEIIRRETNFKHKPMPLTYLGVPIFKEG